MKLKFTSIVRLREWGIVAVAYFITAQLGFAMAIPPGNVTAVWPPSGIALAAMMLFGYQVWPAIWLGSFAANIWSFVGLSAPMPLGVSLATAASIALGSTLQALIGAFLIQRWIGSNSPFDRTQDIFKFVGIELISCLVAATLGATSLAVGKFVPFSAYPVVWWTWWLGDLVGIIVVTPTLIAWARSQPATRNVRRFTEAIVFFVILLAIGLRVFSGPSRSSGALDPLSYVFIPFIVWAAFRFGPRGVTASILIVSTTAIWGTARGWGPFIFGSLNESLIAMQTFIAIEAITGLTLMASLRERERAEQEIKNLSESLERRVLERTAQLAEVNAQFQFELVERQRAEARFRKFLESAPDAMVIIDDKGRIVMANSQVEKEFGYQPEELLNQSIEVMIPDRYHTLHSGHRTNFFLQPRVRAMGKGMELYGLHKNGSELPVEISLSPLDTEQGVLVTAAIRNITERRQTEEALHEAANKVLAIFSAIEDGITVSDSEGRIIDANDAVVKLHSFENKEEFLKAGIAELVSETDRNRLQSEGIRILQSGGSSVFECKLRRKDGSLFDGELRLTRLGDPGKAAPVIIGITRDITERKQAEEILHRQNEYLAALHEITLGLINRLDPDEVLEAILMHITDLMNTRHAYIDILDPVKDTLIQKVALGSYVRLDGFQAVRGQGISGRVWDSGKMLIIPDYSKWEGRLPEFSSYKTVTGTPMKIQGKLIGVIGVAFNEPNRTFTAEDIDLLQRFANLAAIALDNAHLFTERAAFIQELETKNAELDRFTYTVSHDLKSPLVTLQGFIRYLEKDAHSGNKERLKDDLQRINESVDKMQRLITELLELSQIGQLINPPVDISFREIVQDALSRVEGRLKARQIKVEIRGELPHVRVDRNRLVQVMQNLLDNAAKFMGDQPEPHIEIGTRTQDKKNIFYVKDNGIGINPEVQDKVFGLFDKLDARSDGTGIGLALVKRIIEVHGGKVWVESGGAGTGTTFCFTLE